MADLPFGVSERSTCITRALLRSVVLLHWKLPETTVWPTCRRLKSRTATLSLDAQSYILPSGRMLDLDFVGSSLHGSISDVVATAPINSQSVPIVGKERNHPAALMVTAALVGQPSAPANSAMIFKRLDLPDPSDRERQSWRPATWRDLYALGTSRSSG
jgi:hypothetical protein